MSAGVPYAEALGSYSAGGAAEGGPPPIDVDGLLATFHPDHRREAKATLRVGPNRGDVCQAEMAALLQANGLIDDADLAGSESIETDVVVVGGGGAGAAAALAASRWSTRDPGNEAPARRQQHDHGRGRDAIGRGPRRLATAALR